MNLTLKPAFLKINKKIVLFVLTAIVLFIFMIIVLPKLKKLVFGEDTIDAGTKLSRNLVQTHIRRKGSSLNNNKSIIIPKEASKPKDNSKSVVENDSLKPLSFSESDFSNSSNKNDSYKNSSTVSGSIPKAAKQNLKLSKKFIELENKINELKLQLSLQEKKYLELKNNKEQSYNSSSNTPTIIIGEKKPNTYSSPKYNYQAKQSNPNYKADYTYSSQPKISKYKIKKKYKYKYKKKKKYKSKKYYKKKKWTKLKLIKKVNKLNKKIKSLEKRLYYIEKNLQ